MWIYVVILMWGCEYMGMLGYEHVEMCRCRNVGIWVYMGVMMCGFGDMVVLEYGIGEKYWLCDYVLGCQWAALISL
jgi:hypothetical protein